MVKKNKRIGFIEHLHTDTRIRCLKDFFFPFAPAGAFRLLRMSVLSAHLFRVAGESE